MSSFFLIDFSKEKLKYNDLNNLADNIIKNALKNGYAVFLNDSYSSQILKNKTNNISILFSYSFLDRNADELLDLTDFIYDDESDFKKKFFDKFDFLNDVFDILFSYNIKKIDLYITEDGSEDTEYVEVVVKKDNVVQVLYDNFIKYSSVTGYTFPNLHINVVSEKNQTSE